MKAPSKKHQAQLMRAAELLRAGDLGAAETLCRALLEEDPRNFDALHLAGLVAISGKQQAEAILHLRNAVAVNDGNPIVHGLLGLALLQTGQLQDALQSLDTALTLDPNLGSAEHSRAQVFTKLGRLDEAVAAYRRVIELQPEDAMAHQNFGSLLGQLGWQEEALVAHERAAALQPNSADIQANLAATLCVLKRYDTAASFIEKALKLRPGHELALISRIDMEVAQGRLAEAFASAEELIAANPNSLQGHIWRSRVLVFAGQAERALQSSAVSLKIALDDPTSHVNQGWILAALNRHREALMAYDRALALKPDYVDAHFNRAFSLLTLGQFEEGWLAYEYRNLRPRTVASRRYPKPLWWGKAPIKDQRLFLYYEQGLGDTIQFSRYALLAAQLGAKVVLSVQDALRQLFENFDPRILIMGQNEEPSEFDLHCPLLSLPLAFGTNAETIPAATEPYLKVPVAAVSRWAQRLPAGRRRIGLAWSGSILHHNDVQRSVAFEKFLPLLHSGDAWISLQKDPRKSDRPALEASGIFDPTAELDDFADTAALISALDLVITVDTSVAHLAGALCKPVWVMLPFAPDFRWMLRREDSPWYPSMRLFRQQRIGDWDRVIGMISEALQA